MAVIRNDEPQIFQHSLQLDTFKWHKITTYRLRTETNLRAMWREWASLPHPPKGKNVDSIQNPIFPPNEANKTMDQGKCVILPDAAQDGRKFRR